MVEYRTVACNLDLIFAAVSDPTRRAILAQLERKSSTVTELARPFPVSLNAVSKHVMVLERAGLIRREVRGREHHCALVAKPLQEATEWLQHYRQFWEGHHSRKACEIPGKESLANTAKWNKKGDRYGETTHQHRNSRPPSGFQK